MLFFDTLKSAVKQVFKSEIPYILYMYKTRTFDAVDEFKIHQALFLYFQSLSFVYKNDDLCLYKFAGGNIGGFSDQLFHSL